MTVTISYAPTNDGRVVSTDSSYSTAVNGNGTKNVDTTSSSLGTFGQHVGGSYSIYQYFVEFGQAFDTNYVVTDAYFEFTCHTTNGESVDRHMEIREHNWGSSVETFNFRTPSQLSSEPLLAVATTVNDVDPETRIRVGGGGVDRLRARLDSSGTIKCVISTSRNRQSQAPSQSEFTRTYTANESGTAKDPRMLYTSVRKTLLNRVLNSQIQLSDGSHVFAESSSTDHAAQTTTIKHRTADGVTETTIFANNEANRRIGAQCYALVADDDDNVYYVTAFESSSNQLHVRTFIKGSGYVWSETGNGVFISLPWFPAYTNQVVAAWHPVGGIAGTIVAIAGHPFTYKGIANSYAMINVDYLRFGSGTALRGSDSAGGAGLLYLSNPPENYNNNSPNTHGSQIDIARAPGTAVFDGQVVAASQNATYLIPNYVSVARYKLTNDGSGFADVISTNRDFTVIAEITKDANAKCRVLGVSTTGFVSVVADGSVGAGITVCHFNVTESSRTSNITLVDYVHLTPTDIPSMPSEAAMARNNDWDAVFHEDDNKVWVYYFDVANGQRLMRTGVDLSTGLAELNEIEVSASVGAVGSVNRAIRVHRGTTYGTPAMVSVANDNAGTHSMIYVTDTLNIAPTAPILIAKNNFDASGSADFEWTFTDPDSSDAQTAYQLQIDEVGGASNPVYDTGKITSSTESHTVPAATLTNGVEYQWRVMTWDRLDVASPFSDYGSFETSSSGNVTIVDPATDNPPGANTNQVVVEWSVTGAVQDSYLVEVYRTDTEALVHSSGWVTSTSTTHLVTDMVSDVEHRIEVTIRDTALVESSTATRLITPSFATPEQPSVTLVAEPDKARIVLEVFNPEPPTASDTLNTNPDFEVDVSGWEGNNGATISHSTAQAVEGVGSALVTPDGTSEGTRIRTAPVNAIPVTVGQTYRFAPWVYTSNGVNEIAAQIIWRASDGQEFAVSTGAVVAAAAGEWLQLEVTSDAPSSFGGAADALAAVILNFNGGVAATGDTFHVDNAELFVPSDISQVSENQVYRRLAGTQDSWRQIAELGVNGVFYDYHVASKVAYEYMVAGITTPTFSLSDPKTKAVDFKGLWLADPDDVEGTLHQWPYGRARSSKQVNVASGAHHYAGRELPVIDYGESREDVLTVEAEIPRGPNWEWRTEVDKLEEFAVLRRPVTLRDNRGRVLHGAITNFSTKDEVWGTTASFSFTRLDKSEV